MLLVAAQGGSTFLHVVGGRESCLKRPCRYGMLLFVNQLLRGWGLPSLNWELPVVVANGTRQGFPHNITLSQGIQIKGRRVAFEPAKRLMKWLIVQFSCQTSIGSFCHLFWPGIGNPNPSIFLWTRDLWSHLETWIQHKTIISNISSKMCQSWHTWWRGPEDKVWQKNIFNYSIICLEPYWTPESPCYTSIIYCFQKKKPSHAYFEFDFFGGFV